MYGSDYLGSDISEYLDKLKKETDWIKFNLNCIIKKFGWPTLSDKELDGILLNNALKEPTPSAKATAEIFFRRFDSIP